jgi:hypothetical protein
MLVALSCLLALASASSEAPLPGSEISVEAAAEKAQLVVTGTITSLYPAHGSRGSTSYSKVEILPSRILKGRLGESEELKVAIIVHQRRGETPPEQGVEYIFFIEMRDQKRRVIKMLPKTRENLERLPGP